MGGIKISAHYGLPIGYSFRHTHKIGNRSVSRLVGHLERVWQLLWPMQIRAELDNHSTGQKVKSDE